MAAAVTPTSFATSSVPYPAARRSAPSAAAAAGDQPEPGTPAGGDGLGQDLLVVVPAESALAKGVAGGADDDLQVGGELVLRVGQRCDAHGGLLGMGTAPSRKRPVVEPFGSGMDEGADRLSGEEQPVGDGHEELAIGILVIDNRGRLAGSRGDRGRLNAACRRDTSRG